MMKYRFLGLFIILFFVSLLPLSAQSALYKPFTAFRTIQTEHFEIIFPKESEASARLLASYADRIYNEVSTALNIKVPGRIPVTFAPHTDMFNGYYNFLFNHIVLFDTSMDIEWTTFENNLEGLFRHELVHAVSFNSRSPFDRFMHRIFGNLYSPAIANTPYFMAEGVTISMEGSGEFDGRANDPRAKQYLRQAIHEDKFLTPFQTSGVFDRPMQPSGYWYEYGGLFSAWLQKTYGMEKYAELWRLMGRAGGFSFFKYSSGFYRMFRTVYEIDFLTAWNNFRDSLAISNLETNNDDLLPVRYRYFSEKEHFITKLKANGNSIYFLDRTDNKIGIFNTQTGRTHYINAGSYSYDLDISSDGTTLLLSGYSNTEAMFTAVVTEYTVNGRRTGRSIEGFYSAQYFRDGVIGLRSELHNNTVVYENFNGEREVLFRGNERLMFSGPQPIDNDRFVFIAAIDGKRELWLYNYTTQELFRIENPQDDTNYWTYMRNLGVSEGKIFFSHNANDQMYKLGVIDINTMQAVFSDRDFSGGVFHPVSLNDTVYYQGAFVHRYSLLRFPESVNSLSGTQRSLKLVKLENNNYQTKTEIETMPYEGPTKMYNSLKYLNPFRLWFPLPLLRISESGEDIVLDGGGLFSVIADPTDRNMITILAFYDVFFEMAKVDLFMWQNTTFGFPLSISFYDTVVENKEVNYRSTGAFIRGDLNWGANQWKNNIFLGAGYTGISDYQGSKSAYKWELTENIFSIETGFSLSYRDISLSVSGISALDRFNPRVEGLFRSKIDVRFPVQISLFGVYDHGGMDLHSVSNTFGDNTGSSLTANYAMSEYIHPKGLELNWLAGAEIAVNLFRINIQESLGHAYYNSVFGTLALRNQIYDGKGYLNAEGIKINNLHLIQSLMLKVGVKISFLPLHQFPMAIEPFLAGTWNFSNAINNEGRQWIIHYGLMLYL
ncbi:MAG: hypothetical protein LBU88_02730 [Treponema sp.]|jgi:hypothetical protein|nr:hypothetical protein [Treponema sp.]